MSLTSKVECQCGTTWLLKHHMEECGRPPSDGLVDEWYGLVNGLEHWASRLHVLQCMQYMSVPSRRVRQVERFVRAGLTDDTKLVRAWAYSGFYELAGKYPRYRKEAIALLEDAVTSDAAPSVRARVRRLLKQGFPRE